MQFEPVIPDIQFKGGELGRMLARHNISKDAAYFINFERKKDDNAILQVRRVHSDTARSQTANLQSAKLALRSPP